MTKRAAEQVKAEGLVGAAAEATRKRVRRELASLVRAVVDARGEKAAELALSKLKAHRLGAGLAELVAEYLDARLVYLKAYITIVGWCECLLSGSGGTSD